MSENIQLEIQLFSYWHAGSGLSAGTYADAVVLKDEDDFPLLPGKTLKGLIRDAAQQLHELNPEFVTASFIQTVFGKDTSVAYEEPTQASQGSVFFSSASVHPDLRMAINESVDSPKQSPKSYLYQTIAATKIDAETGVAADGSLRKVEVTVPLSLYAVLYDFPAGEQEAGAADYKTQLDRCLQFVKRLGANRHRGFGRCQIKRIN
jgi:CRISPR/Cas system CSM-associated protein Csm3 (group 7 of RAMP superfamily)